MTRIDLTILSWIGLASIATFVLFGFDKSRAKKSRQRISEFQLAFLSAIGGWPGGLVGMCWFRHKTAKRTFRWKFGAAFLFFATAIASYLYWRMR